MERKLIGGERFMEVVFVSFSTLLIYGIFDNA
jgi:hypothetical protein